MIYEVVVSNSAENDLKEIYEYIAYKLLAPVNAAGQLKRLEESILNLNEMPERFPLFNDDPWHSRGMRFMVRDNYVIFYIVNNEKCIVSVLRVLYGGRNIASVFRNDEV